MTSPNPTPKLDELLAQAAWVRALAARLIDGGNGSGRDGDADDLAQDVYVAALVAERRGAIRAPGAWLAGAARNLALAGRRGAARRRAREHAAARPDVHAGSGGECDSGDLVAKAELQGRLIRTVTALPEPLRTTVLLRFFEGLAPSEIGARTGVPASTVRTRLARALERLRMDLDDEHGGDRGAWCAALAKLAGPLVDAGAIAGTASALAGVLLMKGWITIGAAAALLTVAAIAVRSSGAREAPVLERTGGAIAAEPRDGVERSGTELVRAGEPGSAAAPRAAAPAAAPAPASTASSAAGGPAAPPRAAVTARIVDEHGAPLPGAELALQSGDARAEAGADGAVELDVALSGGASRVLVASHAGRATRYVSAVLRGGRATPLGEIELVPGGELVGTVLDPRGRPVAKARVFVTPVEDNRLDPATRRRLGPELDGPVHGIAVDEDGRFDLPGVAPGPARVWATAPGYGFVAAGPIEVAAGANASLAILLTPLADEDVIFGVVLGPDGAPVKASISYDYPHGPGHTYTSRSTDADGLFRLTVVSRAPHNFLFSDEERRWASVPLRGVMPGGEELVIRLRETPSISLRATDEHGAPLEEFGAAAIDARDDGAGELASWRRERGEGTPGELELVSQGLAFHVRVEAVGHEPVTLGPFDAEAPPAELSARLRSLPGISGRVLADGEPVAGARVVLAEIFGEDALATFNGFRCRYISRDAGATTGATTDAEGRFTVFASQAGDCVLRAEADGFAAAEHDLTADPAIAVHGLVIELGQGGAIVGRVLLPDDGDPTGMIVGVNHGDARPRTMRVDRDGRYEFTGLVIGGWHVELRDEELNPLAWSELIASNPDPGPLAVSCTVFEGETTRYDLDLRGRVGGRLRGRLVLADGASGWTAALRRIDAGTREHQEVAQDALDAGGAFDLAFPEPGTYRLILGSPGDAARLRVETTLTLREGDAAWELPLALGAVDGAFADPADANAGEVLLYRWTGTPPASAGSAVEISIRFPPGADGAFHLPRVPVGPGRISRYTTDERGLSQLEELSTFTAIEGRAVTATIR